MQYIIISGSVPSLNKMKVTEKEGRLVEHAPKVPYVNNLGITAVKDADNSRLLRMGDVVEASFFPKGSIENLLNNDFMLEYIPHSLTQEDVAKNPKLKVEGLKVGDEIHAGKKGFTKAAIKYSAKEEKA